MRAEGRPCCVWILEWTRKGASMARMAKICRVSQRRPKSTPCIPSPGSASGLDCICIGLSLFVICLCCTACAAHHESSPDANLLPSLRPYVKEVVGELGTVSAERREVLDAIALDVANQLNAGKTAQMTFICTHNSRRSHMSQIWAQTAACYYGLDKVHTFSGGTQATACNCRTVAAMRRVGFAIEDATKGDNPIYIVRYSDERPAIRAYSKLYNADDNPRRDFIALMTCSVADKSCPVVQGAVSRYAIHYADPRLCDDTPAETTAYNERCREIACEMFYIMAEVRKRLDARPVAPHR